MARHFLNLADVGCAGLRALLDAAHARKAARAGWPQGRVDGDAPLADHVLAAVFEKPSTRTRLSFDIAMRQLGGATITLAAGDMQLGRGETVGDTARALSGYVDAIAIRANRHADVQALAAEAGVPVINALTDWSHPCQIVADVMTVEESLRSSVAGLRWAWLGDGNNVAHSLIEAADLLGFELALAVPEGHDPDPALLAGSRGVHVTRDAAAAVRRADVVVTDTWVSMGQAGGAAKMAAMAPYQVTAALMAKALPHAVFLHCLPAHRGEEVTGDVIDGPQSRVWAEAANRVHAQKAILLWALGRL
ncbi:ornithine carbamoyltransferase [Sandaracinobacteroides saxicola]|uniref:Ornithine carbamoyltransferase n=1 Tax=Sandaracinobacteroides saxicola TaxID=2759707 RepID=A0A7G5IJK3_9SPHN|nr:ornithine carbamoyltransferase [Sandaracinobacteroides saxicola]QMW23545.1 ornithine carbamoyltransferase [Sandaracinobacteroides saxicola]